MDFTDSHLNIAGCMLSRSVEPRRFQYVGKLIKEQQDKALTR